MAYIAPIHRPSSVRHAIKLSFLAQGSEDLIVAKANRLEIYSSDPVQPDQLILRYTSTLFGKVTLLQRLRPAKSETDHLFIGTDRFHYFTVSWDDANQKLLTCKKYDDVAERTARDSQTGDRVHVDPTSRFLTLECYEGIIHVLPITQPSKGKRRANSDEIGELGNAISVRIPELFVKSSCFIHKRHPGTKQPNPELAILWEDPRTNLPRLKFRELEYSASLRPQEEPGSVELEKFNEALGSIESGTSHLIPLPPPMYGLLVVGETSISYVSEWDYRISETTALDEATIFVTWCAIDDQRYVLADDYGKLYLLFVLQNQQGEYTGHRLDVLGETSRASTLVYLSNGRIFVGSHQGDSQVIQISERHLEVIQTFPNIAPILDFTVMDMGNRSTDAPVNEFSSGQARIVTGSGAFKDGSLRSVRAGVGLEDLGTIGDMGEPITSIFSLRSSFQSPKDDVLVVSSVAQTRIFTFSLDAEVEEVETFRGFDFGASTIYAGNVSDNRAIQVTRNSLYLSDADGNMVIDTWTPMDGLSITAVSASSSLILVSLGGASLVLLDVSGSNIRVQARRNFDSTEQVSCIAISDVLPKTCIVGFWRDSRVSFLNLHDLSLSQTAIVAEDDNTPVPRSLAIASVLAGQPPTLFIGLADGNVVTYVIASEDDPFTARKSIILGTQQADLALLPREDGLRNVFATSEHPSLIYGSEGRMVYSAVTVEKASCICSFDSVAYPAAIAIASGSELKLAVVDEERRTHVQTLPVYETVRRISYSPVLKSFGLGTIKRTLIAGDEQIESHFKLVDEVAFQELHTFALNQDELIESCMRCELNDGTGNLAERFVVGTGYLDDTKPGSPRGRLLVFEVTEGRQLKLITERDLSGACRCLGMLHGNIVAALVKTVVVYSFEYETASTPILTKKAVYRTATAPIDLSISNDVIAVSDLMKSASLVKFKNGEGGIASSLLETGRHFDTLWGTAIASVAENTYLEADAEGNLVVLQHEVYGFSEEDRRRLTVVSEMLLGEMVNRIRRIDVTPTPGAVCIPRAFLATVEGSIYLFCLIAPGKQDLLIQMQSRMAEIIQSPGEVPFNSFRGFKTGVRDMSDQGPLRFVDGELIERFLDCSEATQVEVVKVLPGEQNLEDIRLMVEALKRMH